MKENEFDILKDLNQIGEIPNLAPEEVLQGYEDTCAIRSQELILRDFGFNLSQEDLIQESTEHGWYNGNGTSFSDIGKLLELHGVDVTVHENANIFNLVTELSQGHRIIIAVDSNELWGTSGILSDVADALDYKTPDHALLLSGIDTSDPDDVKVILTDPGTGDVAKTYSMDEFEAAWEDSNHFMVTTNDPAPVTVDGMENFDYDQGHLDDFAGIDYSHWLEYAALAGDTVIEAPVFQTTLSLMQEFLGEETYDEFNTALDSDTNEFIEVATNETGEFFDGTSDGSDLDHFDDPNNSDGDLFDDDFGIA